MKRFNANLATTAMLGDQLVTDILGAKRLGICAIEILTGVVTRADLAASSIQPDLVFEDLGELAKAMRAA
jgi:4-nitrophenyl phosphatase/NagD protein